MDESVETNRAKRYRQSRTIYNIAMGLLIISIGIIAFFAERWNLTTLTSYDPMIRNSFGVLCLIYGGFRLYRGFQKEY
ncbi:MAG: hypothetical protein ABIY35_02645 [Chitinophagaceae bacterium]